MGRGRLLVGLAHLPSASRADAVSRLLSALLKNWHVDVFPAGPSPDEARRVAALSNGRAASVIPASAGAFCEALKRAASRGDYRAVLIVDGESTRAAAAQLGAFLPHKPVVLVALDAPIRSLSGDLAVVEEVWSLGRLTAPPRGVLPKAFRRAAPTSAGLDRLIDGLGRPAPAHIARRGRASVIVPCWNGLAYTKQCLASVLRWTRTPFELIVVDNGSTDGTADYVRRLKDRRIRLIVNRENLGFARAVNQGMSAARGDHLIWLNSDAVVTPRWLERLIACAERAPWVGAVGPYTNEINGLQRVEKVPYRALSGLTRFAEALALRNAGRARRAHRLTGFCLLVKRDAVRRVGLLDESFGAGCYEDFDYCLRLRLAGYELLLAEDAFVHHHGHKTFERAGIEVNAAAAANREVFIDKWCRRALSFLDELDPHLTAPSPRRRK